MSQYPGNVAVCCNRSWTPFLTRWNTEWRNTHFCSSWERPCHRPAEDWHTIWIHRYPISCKLTTLGWVILTIYTGYMEMYNWSDYEYCRKSMCPISRTSLINILIETPWGGWKSCKSKKTLVWQYLYSDHGKYEVKAVKMQCCSHWSNQWWRGNACDAKQNCFDKWRLSECGSFALFKTYVHIPGHLYCFKALNHTLAL